jgi:hypothetical protein
MIYGNVELFNAEQIYDLEDVPGKVLNRFSAHAIAGLDRGADRRGPITQAYGNEIEIRFVSESDTVEISIGAWDNDGYVSVGNGDYDNCTVYLPQGEMKTIKLERHPRLALMASPGPERFSKSVWRITYLKRFTPVFSYVKGEGIRPPEPGEVPRKTMLAYGSSITFGAGTGPMSALTHMQILARDLGIQVMNKSMPGSCFCEFSYGDYLSNTKADFYYYELGGNMRLRHSPEEFKKRAVHIVTETRRKNPSAPIILLTVYPLLKSIPDEDHVKAARVIEEYDGILANLAGNDDNIHLIDSAAILNDTRLLSFDGLHPSGYGNVVMAANIYDKIKHIVQVP